MVKTNSITRKNKPEISIIVPVYNGEAYIEKCLTSLLEQTYRNIEIILINDGSADDSLKLLKKFASKDKRIILFSQKNKGIAAAHTQGLKLANGQFVMFCDIDDWYEKDMCEKMLYTLEDQNADMVICNTNVISSYETHYTDYLKNTYTGKHQVSLPLIQKTNVILCNKIFKKDLITKYHIRFPLKHENDDDCFFMQYVSIAKNICYLENKLYNYYIHRGSMSEHYQTRNIRHLYDRFYVLQTYYLFLVRNKLLSKLSEFFAWFLFVEYSCMIKNMTPPEIKKLQKMIEETFIFTNNTFIKYILKHRQSINFGKIKISERKIQTKVNSNNRIEWYLLNEWFGKYTTRHKFSITGK